MKVKLTNRNQITIPKSLANELKLKAGHEFELLVDDDKLVISTDLKSKKTTNKKKCDVVSSLTKSSKSKIVSNIEDISKYDKPKVSPCGLVVRSKTSYVKQFCEKCNGQLINESNLANSCPHKKRVKKNVAKQIINNLVDNVNKLNKDIDEQINELSLKDDTIIKGVALKDYSQCEKCGEFFNRGIMLDDKFYCKSCAKEDFVEYLDKRKRGK